MTGCGHGRVDHITSIGGALLGYQCRLCFAVAVPRRCVVCRAFGLADRRGWRRILCGAPACRRARRSAQCRARRALRVVVAVRER